MEDELVTSPAPESPPAPDSDPMSEPTPAPEPVPDSDSAPESEPLPDPEPSEPEPTPDPGMTVVSVDELVDRLLQSEPEEAAPTEEAPAEEEPAPEEVTEEAETPGVIHSSYVLDETTMAVVQGMDELLQRVEVVQQNVDNPFLTTNFKDYTVTEGLLLLLLLFLFIKACISMVRSAFSWLL